MKRLAFPALVAISLMATTALAETPVDTLVIGKAADPQTIDPAVTIDTDVVEQPLFQHSFGFFGFSDQEAAICA